MNFELGDIAEEYRDVFSDGGKIDCGGMLLNNSDNAKNNYSRVDDVKEHSLLVSESCMKNSDMANSNSNEIKSLNNNISDDVFAQFDDMDIDGNLLLASSTPTKLETSSLLSNDNLPYTNRSKILMNSTNDRIVDNVQFCRVCMQPNEVLVSMFEKCPSESYFVPQSKMRKPDRVTQNANVWYDDQTIRDKVKFCSTVQVLETEELSSVICNPCLSDLIVAYRFKKRLEESDEMLRKKLGLKNKTIVKTEFVLIDCNDMIEKSSLSETEGMAGKSSFRRKRRKIKQNLKPNMNVEDVYADNAEDEKYPDKYKYKCDQCDRSFQYPSALNIHIATHNRQNKNKNYYYVLKNNKRLLPEKRGRVLITPPPAVEKDLPLKNFNSKAPSKRNKNPQPKDIEKSKEAFKCCHCEKTFEKNRSLKLHEKIHTRMKKHSCTDCTEQFSNMQKLQLHQKESHTALNCVKCDRVFKNRLSFVKHVENHKKDSVIQKVVVNTQVKSNVDLFKSIAPLTTTYWSDSYSD